MSQQIPFLEELKQDLMEHAPGHAASPWRPQRFMPGGVWLAATVFIGVLIIGGLSWMLRPGSPPLADAPPMMSDWDLMVYLTPVDDAEALLAQIDAIPGVVESEYVADIAGLQPEPTARLNVAAVLIRIDSPQNAEPVAAEIIRLLEGARVSYSEEIAAVEAEAYFEFAVADAAVIGEDPPVLQAPLGPDPAFDPSELGAEVALAPAQSADEISETFFDQAQTDRTEEHKVDPEGPVIHIGYLDEIDTRLIVYRTVSNGSCARTETGTGSGSSCGDFSLFPYGVVQVGSGSQGNDGDVSVRVPEDTSIVTLSLDGNESQWQRPRAGWGLFPLTTEEPSQFTVEAYDAEGNLIGHWGQAGG